MRKAATRRASQRASEREMTKRGAIGLLLIGVAAAFTAEARAEDIDIGKAEFQASCASCHGVDARGKGPVSDLLKVPPPDLTTLARNNNGVFPTNALYDIIDGSKAVAAHGTRDMPI